MKFDFLKSRALKVRFILRGFGVNTLKEINQKISSGQLNNDIQQNELFYSLAESIITDQRFVFNHLSKMSFMKLVTNEEIFMALLNAKSFKTKLTATQKN